MNTTKQHCLSFYNDQGILTLNAKQFDTGRIFVFDIMDHDEPFDLTGCSASLHIQKADGTQFQGEDCCIIDTTKITINPALGNGAQILAADGVNVCELVLKDSEGLTLTTWDFHINVLKRVHNGENLKSSDAYDILDKIDRDEKIRKENESARIEAEQTRKTSEITRQTNETLRINAEEARKTAEVKRQEDTAKAIADAEKATKECIALNHEAESWAHGGTGIRPEEDTDNSKYWCQQSKDYADSWKGSLLPKGILNFAQLPTSGMTAGHLYHINDAFVTDGRFKEGAGYSYPAGTNVYWTQDGKWDCLSGVLTKVLSQAEYNALSESQKRNGTIYYIEDADNSIGEATATEKGLVKVDAALSTTSANPVQNKIVTTGLNDLTTTLTAAVGNKVDKVSGKGLSTNDYTTAEKNKLSGIAAGAEVNVQADWNVTDSGSDAFIKNKPAIPSVGNGTVMITQNGTNKGSFTMNQAGNTTIELTDNNTTYPYYTKSIDASFTTKFRTETKGNTTSGNYISNIRTETSNIGNAPQYGAGLAWGSADTHGYLNVNYNTAQAYIGGGNADKLNWIKQLAFMDSNVASAANADTVDGKHASDLQNYNNLTNKPTIPSVGNGTLTIQKNGANILTFTANQSANATANITVPTKTSDLTNDSGFVTSGGGETLTVYKSEATDMSIVGDWRSPSNHAVTNQNNYYCLRFSSGIQILAIQVSSRVLSILGSGQFAYGTATITFPYSFINNYYFSMVHMDTNTYSSYASGPDFSVAARNSSSISVKWDTGYITVGNTCSEVPDYFEILTIGRWK